ncbi:UDP-N-acetylmuramoyl-L-alanyl-D-glutamate--2,6-diaminopimelate ligase [Butyricimonas synergistica]|uniref:UDP-N-acetylmuramoyl-L-alanyl-D-glutamate--2, 6-diaminopimelate ligase n=1 Tax=Butyricimonas synergistica TaxID=544644 RepID=UPI00039EF624|nr:UDP-N-acetylmuramoyl-L-alanyl-D-glutamate--2,6-diaminopimelate ligase [Butyricimonas synergistica]
MKLKDLLEGVACEIVQGGPEAEVSAIHFDSRKVGKGDVFVAQRGVSVDGHAFIGKAIAGGAIAVVCEEVPENLPEGIVVVKTANSSEALGWMASAYYGHPSRKMKLVGVTGTNGKTTTATLLYEVARLLGKRAGLLSTVCNYVGDEKVHATHTTPDALEINSLMKRMVDEGCEYCFMEVSSHAADQRRISGLDFDGAIFSNITHDHLDYHKTFRAYIEAKKGFFDRLSPKAFALTNTDDKNGMVMLQNTKARKYTYSCKRMADFNCKTLERHLDSMLLLLDGSEVWTKFTGDFNAYNLLAVYSAARLLGFDKEELLPVMSMLVPVSGRFETILSREGVMAVVDYAHTPDALENVLSTIGGLKKDGTVITVVGAGGDRDRTKRPEMAEVACRLSDRVVLTSDNPRSEEPAAIIEDMRAGVPEDARDRVLAIADRKEAIRTALMLAKPGDIVLVAGKGHEDYQEIKGVKHHFDDKEVIKEIFKL